MAADFDPDQIARDYVAANDDRIALRASTQAAVRGNPDEYAEALKLSTITRVPPLAALDSLADVRQQAQVEELDKHLGTKTGFALSDPNFSRLAIDDADTLAGIEKTFNDDGFRPAAEQLRQAQDAKAGARYSRVIANMRPVDGLDRLQSHYMLDAASVAKGAAGAGAFAADLFAAYPDSAAARIGLDPFGKLRDAFLSAGQQAGQYASQARADLGDRGLAGNALIDAETSIEQQLPLMMAALLTGNPQAFLSTSLTGMGALQTGSSFVEATDAGVRGPARTAYSLSQGVIEAATEMLPEIRLLKGLNLGAPVWKLILENAVNEQIGEQAATVLQDANDWAVLHPEKTLDDYLAERPDAAIRTALTTAIASGLQSGAIVALERSGDFLQSREAARQSADRQKELLGRLAQMSAASKVRQRSAENFQSFMRDVADDGPAEHVYVNPEQLRSALQQSGVTTDQIEQAIPGLSEQIEVGAATGTDVQIPTAQLMTYLPSVQGLDQALTPHLKIEAGGYSQAEAGAFLQSQADAFSRTFEDVEGRRRETDEFSAGAQRVRDDIAQQLAATQRFRPEVTNAYADMMGAFYSTTARRAGITPEALYQGAGRLRIAAESPFGGALDQNAQTDTSEFNNWFGDSKVVGANGKPLVVYHGTGADFDTFDRGTSGKGPSKLGFWLTDRPDFAESFGNTLMPAYVAISNPKVLTQAQWDAMRMKHGGDAAFFAGLREQYVAQGHDGMMVPATTEKVGRFDVAVPALFAAFEPTQIKSAIGNRGTFDPADPNILRQGLNKEARGAFSPDTRVLALLQSADLSTFHHEAAHFFLEVMSDLSAQENAPPAITSDFGTFLKWAGVESAEKWHAMTLDEKRDAHEKFARGFEAYLFEGRAPSVELRGLFARFSDWIRSVYRSLKNLNVELDPEIRGVYDRLLASEEEITRAKNFAGMVDGIAAGDMDKIHELARQATDDALGELQTRSLRDMRWLSNARSRALKELQDSVKDKRKDVQAEVTAEIRQESAYAALRFLKRGELPPDEDGAEREALAGHKLSIPAMEDLFADDRGAPNWKALGTGKYGVLAKDGIAPDLIAAMFGFGNADQMVRGMLEAVPEAQEIEARTDRLMLERYGDLTSDEAMSRAADAAVHNEARARTMAATLTALESAGKVSDGRVNLLVKAAREFAKSTIDRKRIRDVKPAQFEAAESKAQRAVNEALKGRKPSDPEASAKASYAAALRRALADGAPQDQAEQQSQEAADTAKRRAQVAQDQRAGRNAEQEAIRQQRNALVANQQAKAAMNALGEVAKGVRYLRKFNSESTRKKIDAEYRDQIDQLLERYDLRQISNRAADRRARLAGWIKTQEGMGLTPDIPDSIRDDAGLKPYRDMTVAEFRSLIEAVKNIEHLGRLKHRLLTAQDKRAFEAVAADIANAIVTNTNRKADEQWSSDRGALVKAKRVGANFLAAHRRFSSLVHEMDGFKDGGLIWERLVRNMNAATDAEATMLEQATERLAEITAPILAGQGLRAKTGVAMPNGRRLTREETIGFALNLGNETNRERVLTGEGIDPVKLAEILSTLTAEDLQFVRSVWGLLDSYRPQIAAKQRRLTGAEPEWIEGALAPELKTVADRLGVDLGDGGYYPIAYDPLRDDAASNNEVAEIATQMKQGAFTRSQTRRGHLKERVKSTGRPMRYDLDVISKHVNQVIHDLAWHEYLIDANRLVRDEGIKQAIRSTYGPEMLQQIKNHLNSIAVGNVGSQDATDGVVNRFRHTSSVAGLAYNLTNSLINLTGLAQSMARIGPMNVAKGMAHWAGNAARLESSLKDIHGRSEFMRLRGKTMLRELSEINSKLDVGTDGAKAKFNAFLRTMYILQTKTQLIVDVPTWYGAYEKAMTEPVMTEEKAIALADQAVRDAQGHGAIADLSNIMKGGAGQKLFTSFYSFFNSTYNLNVEALRRLGRKPASPAQWVHTATDLALVNVAPTIIGTVITAALRGFSGDDDGEKLKKKIIADQIGYIMGQFVLVREFTGAVKKLFGVGDPFGYSGPSSLRFINDIYRLGEQTAQGEIDAAWRRAAIGVAGDLFGMPATQVNRTWDGIEALANEETDNPLAPLVGVPMN